MPYSLTYFTEQLVLNITIGSREELFKIRGPGGRIITGKEKSKSAVPRAVTRWQMMRACVGSPE